MPQIAVHYYPEEGGEMKIIPVNYQVEQREDLAIRIMHCTVALSAEEIPQWLHPRNFELIAHKGYVVSPYSRYTDEIRLSIPDADSFRYKVYGKILSDEMIRERSAAIY